MKKIDLFAIIGLAITGVMLIVSVGTKVYIDSLGVPKLLNPIVRLVQGGHTFCSGVVIDKTTIVTAGHCTLIETPFGAFVNPEPIEIRAADDKPRGTFAKVKRVMPQLDRAVLKGDFSSYDPKPYINDVAKSVKTRKEGEEYLSCGYPLGGKLYCSKATYLRDDGFAIAIKGVLIPGMSGGPTMLTDGTVIAINCAVQGDFAIVQPIYNVDMMK